MDINEIIVPPTEIEIAEVISYLNRIHAHAAVTVVRRLAFQHNLLKDAIKELEKENLELVAKVEQLQEIIVDNEEHLKDLGNEE